LAAGAKVTESMESAGSVKPWADTHTDTQPVVSEVRHSQEPPFTARKTLLLTQNERSTRAIDHRLRRRLSPPTCLSGCSGVTLRGSPTSPLGPTRPASTVASEEENVGRGAGANTTVATGLRGTHRHPSLEQRAHVASRRAPPRLRQARCALTRTSRLCFHHCWPPLLRQHTHHCCCTAHLLSCCRLLCLSPTASPPATSAGSN
jgi:hypothetical protein